MSTLTSIHKEGGIGLAHMGAVEGNALKKAIAKEFDIFTNTHLRSTFVDDLFDVLQGKKVVEVTPYEFPKTGGSGDFVRSLNKQQGVRRLVKQFAGAPDKGNPISKILRGAKPEWGVTPTGYYDTPLLTDTRGNPMDKSQSSFFGMREGGARQQKYTEGRKLFKFERPELDSYGSIKNEIAPITNSKKMSRKFASEMLQRVRKIGKAGLIPMILLSVLGAGLFGKKGD